MKKRRIISIIIILVCFILQNSLCEKVALAGVSPNLMIIITSIYGFISGKKEGIFFGFCSGLLMDIYYGDIIGLYALIYMLIGYGNGWIRKLFYSEDISLPVTLVAVSDFVYGIAVYFLLFLLNSKFQFFYYLGHIIIPEVIYTVIIAFAVYHLLRRIDINLYEEEKRSASKFV